MCTSDNEGRKLVNASMCERAVKLDKTRHLLGVLAAANAVFTEVGL